MKDYQFNKYPKDPRFLAVFRKSFNNYRLKQSQSIEQTAHELGMSKTTYDAKLRPSNDENHITISDMDHLIDISKDTRPLEYLCSKHGFELKKIDIQNVCKNTNEISNQADKAMIEFNEAWKTTKEAIEDEELTTKEIIQVSNEIDEAIKELHQLKQDLNCKLEE